MTAVQPLHRFPQANLLENAQFNSLVVIPNAVQGLFRRRSKAVAAATLAGIDGKAVHFLAGLSRKYDGRPVWVRMALDEALLILDPDDVGRVLNGSPDQYAADPDAKRKGMVVFQPEALTISRGEQWRSRRRFTDAVMEQAGPPAGMSDWVQEVTCEEIAKLDSAPITWEPWNRAVQRITRRVVLGDAAAGDWALTDTLEQMMSAGNSMSGKPSEHLKSFTARVAAYIERAESPSLASLFAAAPTDELTAPVGQVTHWMFALGDTLAANALRALVVLANSSEHRERALADDTDRYLTASLREAMRLWPTTPMLSRQTISEIDWGEGRTIASDTQLVIVNTFGHRDPDRLTYADRFAPEEWIDGTAADYQGFNAFSRGPQGCPGEHLSILVGAVALRTALTDRAIESVQPKLRSLDHVPHMLDYFHAEVRPTPVRES